MFTKNRIKSIWWYYLPLFVDSFPFDLATSSSNGIADSAALVLLPSVMSLLASSLASLFTDFVDLADLAKIEYQILF